MLVPKSRCVLVSTGALAPIVGQDRVAVVWDEDDVFDGIYSHVWTETGKDGIGVSARIDTLTMAQTQTLVDEARRVRPTEYHDARHGKAQDAARPNRPDQRWAGYAGRTRRNA